MRRRTLVLFPGALGDLLCCWPAFRGLVRTGEAITLCSRMAWVSAFPADVFAACISIDRREIAEIFATGPLSAGPAALLGGCDRAVSFTGSGDANFAARLAHVVGGVPFFHHLRGMSPGVHAATYLARCLDVAPHEDVLPVAAAAQSWTDDFWSTHSLGARVLAVHAGSGARQKNWEGAADAVAAWRRDGGQVVAVTGPAEVECPTPLEATAWLRDESLDRVAAVLRRAARYLGNDSGISHLAGLVGARGVAVFGGTDPSIWRPLGSGIAVLHAPSPCLRCGRGRLCTHRISVDEVLAALVRP